ncbi:MAG: nucleotidyltransferase [Planctomycetes bacterium]|nr:nucleotidyltransferase [Planctomycetota bacterium]
MAIPKSELPLDEIRAFCERWRARELALFGSALRDDFGPESDVDVLLSFASDAQWGLFDLARMKRELEAIFGREVDVLTRQGVEASRNPVRRQAILASVEVIHAT